MRQECQGQWNRFLEEGMWIDIEIQCVEVFGASVYDVYESLRYNASELRS